MRSLDRYIFRWMGCLLACVALMACTKEIAGEREDPGEEERPGQVEELEAVTIRIGAAETAETKAMHGDENAVEGEFIHTLHLFIVDESSTIEKHIVVTPESTDLDDTQKEQAESGNLPQYTTTVDLMPGKKTMYAFANMKNAMTATDNQNMETYLSGLHEGEEWKDIQSTVIQNPAEKVDIASAKYIPMSVRQEVDLTTDGQRVTLSLVRMVAKVRATLTNQQGKDVTLTKVTMTGLASSVALFRQEAVNNPAGETTWTYESEAMSVSVANDESYTIPDFYINETSGGGFVLTLTIDDTEYEGILKTETIARNHVLPVALRLSDASLQLTITAHVAPIGGYPVEVNLTKPSLTEVYAIALPEGCTFSITGKFMTTTNDNIDITDWTWNVSAGSESLIALDKNADDSTPIPVTGNITALPGQDISLDFVVSQPNRVEGTLLIETVPLQGQDTDYPAYSGSQARAVDWCAAPRWYEPVMLMRNEE